jgi:hypothetical protein
LLEVLISDGSKHCFPSERLINKKCMQTITKKYIIGNKESASHAH